MSTHYDTLSVSSNASDAEITKAYRLLMLKHHPDKNLVAKKAVSEKFSKLINSAYDVLSGKDDPKSRKKYDATMEKQKQATRKKRFRKTNSDSEEEEPRRKAARKGYGKTSTQEQVLHMNFSRQQMEEDMKETLRHHAVWEAAWRQDEEDGHQRWREVSKLEAEEEPPQYRWRQTAPHAPRRRCAEERAETPQPSARAERPRHCAARNAEAAIRQVREVETQRSTSTSGEETFLQRRKREQQEQKTAKARAAKETREGLGKK